VADISTLTINTPNGSHRVRIAGTGPPLLVIPGGPGFGATYLIESVTEALGDHHQLVFIDQRGTGRSPVGRGDLTMEAYVEDIVAIAIALDLEQFDLMGHSFGGLQTMYVAAAHSGRVRRIVLLDGVAPSRPLHGAALAPGTAIHARSRPEDAAEQASISADADWMFDQEKLNRWIVLEFRSWYSDPTTSSKIPHDFDGAMYQQWQRTQPLVYRALGDCDIAGALPSIGIPTLLVYCRESILGRDVPETYNRLLPNSALVWVGGGHDPAFEDPAAFAAAVLSFLGA